MGEYLFGARRVWFRARAVSLLLLRRQDQAIEQTCPEGFLNSYRDGIDGVEIRKSMPASTRWRCEVLVHFQVER